MSREKSYTIRNTSRRKIFLHVPPDIAARARREKIVGIHVDKSLFVLGDRDGDPEIEAKPESRVPGWFWDGVKSFADTQAKAIKGWMDDGTLVEYAA